VLIGWFGTIGIGAIYYATIIKDTAGITHPLHGAVVPGKYLIEIINCLYFIYSFNC